MFDGRLEGASPDVLECANDPAVRVCDPPVRVWVDLKALTRRPGAPYNFRRGGVFVDGTVRGNLWAWVATVSGGWLGVVSLELERGGSAIMTAQALVPDWALQRRVPGRDSRNRRGQG